MYFCVPLARTLCIIIIVTQRDGFRKDKSLLTRFVIAEEVSIIIIKTFPFLVDIKQ